MSASPTTDLTDVSLWMDDPYPALRRLRETDPVHWHVAHPDNIVHAHPFWALTRHSDIVHVSRHPEIFSSAQGFGANSIEIGFSDYDTFAMLGADDPYHTWMRALVSSAFTAKMTAAAEPAIRRSAIEILDALSPRRHEVIDFVHEISVQLPIRVIGDVLGVPREDQHLLATWTDEISEMGDIVVDVDAGTAHSVRAQRALGDMFDYLERMQESRAAAPTDDLVTGLMGAEIDGQKLNWRQQRECFFILATAGNDTTRNTTSHGAKALYEHADQRADLIADYGLMRGAVEEFLRWGSAVTHFRRTATQDTELGDKHIAKGDWVVMYYSAANRDPEVFENPDTFDIRRSPNNHLAFGGGGPHFCLGAPLARLELRVTFEELLRRYPNYAVVGDAPATPSNFFHGIASMPVILEPR